MLYLQAKFPDNVEIDFSSLLDHAFEVRFWKDGAVPPAKKTPRRRKRSHTAAEINDVLGGGVGSSIGSALGDMFGAGASNAKTPKSKRTGKEPTILDVALVGRKKGDKFSYHEAARNVKKAGLHVASLSSALLRAVHGKRLKRGSKRGEYVVL